ncbi:MAG: DUF1501 domain-containing protein [Deltaproteobacteria bacterium]|nr:DUF1501 domain-containing protein [Deltaproteobacteria bacterium]MDQ3296720.1 DUF1501 domain-containing protein [Myxococcota bacterium]
MSSNKTRPDLNRRDLLKYGLAGLGSGIGLSFLSGCGVTSSTDEAAQAITPTNAYYDAVIQVFFGGGPSQTDTFDPKPGSVNNVFTASSLGVNDKYNQPIYLSSVLAKIAATVQAGTAGLGVVRSLVHTEGDHSGAVPATQSFWRTVGPAMLYPTIASVMAYYFQGQTTINIPSVAFDGTCNESRDNPIPTALNARSSGMSSVLTRPVTTTRYERRMRMLNSLNAGKLAKHPDELAQAVERSSQEAYKITTAGLAAAAFDLTGKPLLPATDTSFSRKLTTAQELVKAGVPYVALGLNGNDSHENNKAVITDRWGNNADPAIAQLATNLKASGKRVLVLMGGEFGRTPKIPTDPTILGDGRDHWREGFSWAFLSINQPKFRTGAIGATGPDGLWTQTSTSAGGLPGKLVDPVELKDLGAFIYRALGFQVGTSTYNVPLTSGMAPPVDPVNNSSNLMSYFGLV